MMSREENNLQGNHRQMLEKQTFLVKDVDDRLREKNGSHPMSNLLLPITDRLFLFLQNNMIQLVTVDDRSTTLSSFDGDKCFSKLLFEFVPYCPIQSADLTRTSSESYLLAVVDDKGIGYVFEVRTIDSNL